MNALTSSRIVGAVALLALEPLSAAYFAVYVFCGASDALDGWIARRTRVASAFGASLDSVADTVFVLAILASLLPQAALPNAFWVWIGAIAAIKAASLVVGRVRFQAYAALHTYANKIAGFALFALPLLFVLVGTAAAATAVCALATLAALEELALIATMRELDRDAKGWLFAR